MITEAETAWLEENYPTLKANADRTEVSGDLTFTGAYDSSTGQFTPLTRAGQTASGIVVTDTYSIVLKKKADGSVPSLRLIGDKIKPELDRHFYTNGAACLCGTVEEFEFMRGGYSFPRYLEQLVFPFLYAQTFYDAHKRWPWGEYAHGAAGIIESYYRSQKSSEHAEVCLQKLKKDKGAWPRVEALLSGREHINGATNCVCGGRRHKLKEHGAVWFGIFQLRTAVATLRLPLKKEEATKD